MDKSDRTIDATKSSITIERCRGRERERRGERKDETYRIENRRESGAQTTGGSAGSNEFQAITTIEYFSDGTRWEVAEGRQRNGRPCVYYLLRYTRGKAKLSLPLFLCVSRTLQTFLRLSPLSLPVPYIIAHYSYDEI